MLSESTRKHDPAIVPQLGAVQPEHQYEKSALYTYRSNARQWGELQAELLRLRLLFSRIVDSADLGGEEFALAVELTDDRYVDALLMLEDTPGAARQRFTLAKRAVDHMTTQSEGFLGLTERRQQERRFTLSGTPAARAQITSRFGFRIDPRSGKKRFHRGLDYGGSVGSKVLALADGVVTYSGKNGGYGNLIELEHANGYRTRYAHNEFNMVEKGSKVSKGQVIATMGSTGKSTGTHVHVEVHLHGEAIDPLEFVSAESSEQSNQPPELQAKPDKKRTLSATSPGSDNLLVLHDR